MTNEAEKFRAEGLASVTEEHVAARDMRTDRITAKLLDMVDRLQRETVEHMMKEADAVRELKEGLSRVEIKIAEFVSAFPDGDAIQHRLAHEAQMEEARATKLFWEKIKFTLVALALAAAITWVTIVLWKAFLLGPA